MYCPLSLQSVANKSDYIYTSASTEGNQPAIDVHDCLDIRYSSGTYVPYPPYILQIYHLSRQYYEYVLPENQAVRKPGTYPYLPRSFQKVSIAPARKGYCPPHNAAHK